MVKSKLLGTWTVGKNVRKVMLIPAGWFFVNHNFQRELNATRAKQIIAKWQDNGMRGLVATCHGPRKYSVLDGQHRIEAFRRVYGNNALVLCEVLELSKQQEGAVFTTLNMSKVPSGNEKFRAALDAGEKEYVQIHKLVKRYGFEIHLGGSGRINKDTNLMVSAGNLYTIYIKFGEEVFEKMLRVLKEVYWDRSPQPAALSPDFRLGLAAFLASLPEIASLDNVILTLIRNQTPATSIVEDVQIVANGSRRQIYNLYANKFKDMVGLQYRRLSLRKAA